MLVIKWHFIQEKKTFSQHILAVTICITRVRSVSRNFLWERFDLFLYRRGIWNFFLKTPSKLKKNSQNGGGFDPQNPSLNTPLQGYTLKYIWKTPSDIVRWFSDLFCTHFNLDEGWTLACLRPCFCQSGC